MSLTAPKNTLAYQLHARPLARLRSMGSVTMGQAADRMGAYMATPEGQEKVKPETDAIWFYLMSHAMRELTMAYDPHEPLPPAAMGLVEEYNLRAAKSMQRALYYMVVICAREARHLPTTHKEKVKAAITEAGLHPSTLKAVGHFQDTSDWTMATKVFRQYLSDAPITDVLESLRLTFENDGYTGGYGGKPWADVTRCPEDFVKGRITAEVMLDTVWTLAHNNGPIFNKGFLYSHHSHVLIEVLDLQRAGMIPLLTWVESGVESVKYVTPEHRAFRDKLLLAVPGSADFQKAPINWLRVKELGAVGHYAAYVAAMSPELKTAQSPQTSIHKAKPHITPVVPPVPVPETPSSHPEKFFSISPMMAVKKKTRPKKAGT